MRRTQQEIETLLHRAGGVLARREHPELARSMSWLVRTGELCRVLPGIYAAPGVASDPRVLIRAAMLWMPDAVLIGPAAARVSFWPEIRVPAIRLAVPRQSKLRPPGFELVRSTVPPELVQTRGALRITVPALTALDLCDSCGGDGIDMALRTRATTLDQLHRAMELSAGRPGNRRRRQLLLDSRDNPWSAAERLAHRLLREAGITGWRANYAVTDETRTYFLDVAFEEQKVALEIDGRLHETDEDLFESDRWRQNVLVQRGWRVLRFTWAMLTEHPEVFVATVLATLNAKR